MVTAGDAIESTVFTGVLLRSRKKREEERWTGRPPTNNDDEETPQNELTKMEKEKLTNEQLTKRH